MQLWIRSQNRKELLNVNNLAVIENRIVFINNGNGRATLGIYKSKERALEVLDEIENILMPKLPKAIIGKNATIIPLTNYVYQMPKD